MNRQIRRLGAGLIACYLLLFAQLNRVQVFDADALRSHPDNTRQVLASYSRSRGTISTSDGAIVARSVEDDSTIGRHREYPEGELYSQVSGYFSLHFGSAGVERSYDEQLAGQTPELELRSLSDLFVDRDRSGSLVLTIRSDVQRAARDALGEQEGSVVALDPRTGEILALWSWPSYDPNLVSDPDLESASNARSLYLLDDRDPMLGRAYQERYSPGSTFKVVVAAAGLESGLVGAESPVYEQRTEWTPPLTNRPISNAGGSRCGGSLFEILRVSCNTAFAEMGSMTIGPERLVRGAEALGFNEAPPIDLPNAATSNFPTDYGAALSTPGLERPDPALPGTVFENTPALAQASIGQFDVASSPLGMALVAAAVANGGVMMEPRVVREVRDADGRLIESFEPRTWRRSMSTDSASTLRRAMIEVVASGTARRIAIPGVEVAAKTGTARVSEDPPRSHAWIIGFAGPPGEVPQVAVAVVVLAQEGASEQTGGRVAAPIARAVVEAALAPPPLPVAPDTTTTTPPDAAGTTTQGAASPRPAWR